VELTTLAQDLTLLGIFLLFLVEVDNTFLATGLTGFEIFLEGEKSV